jgi:hypothetical protein
MTTDYHSREIMAFGTHKSSIPEKMMRKSTREAYAKSIRDAVTTKDITDVRDSILDEKADDDRSRLLTMVEARARTIDSATSGTPNAAERFIWRPGDVRIIKRGR